LKGQIQFKRKLMILTWITSGNRISNHLVCKSNF